MAHQRLSHKIAQESQLLAEERWIKEALTKIKNQRNCLQIERLHLESMKGQLKLESEKDSQKEFNQQMSQIPVSEQLDRMIKSSMEFEVPIIDKGCDEELNLDVNNPYGNLVERDNFGIEEEEEEDDDMGDEDLLIDMNMFMNGKQTKWDKI